jgi:predicted O-methyltransferase YrrM
VPITALAPGVDPNPYNPECREPIRYHIARGGGTELEVGEFLGGLVRALQPRFVIETGTAGADSSLEMAKALQKNGHGRLFTVEIGPGRAKAARARLAGLPAEVILGDAIKHDWSAVSGEIDLAFIDGGTDRKREFMQVYPHLAWGAFVVFHDTGNDLAPLKVVNELVDEGLLDPPILFPTPRGFALSRIPRR